MAFIAVSLLIGLGAGTVLCFIHLYIEDRKAEGRYEKDIRERQFQRWIDDWKIDS